MFNEMVEPHMDFILVDYIQDGAVQSNTFIKG